MRYILLALIVVVVVVECWFVGGDDLTEALHDL